MKIFKYTTLLTLISISSFFISCDSDIDENKIKKEYEYKNGVYINKKNGKLLNAKLVKPKTYEGLQWSYEIGEYKNGVRIGTWKKWQIGDIEKGENDYVISIYNYTLNGKILKHTGFSKKDDGTIGKSTENIYDYKKSIIIFTRFGQCGKKTSEDKWNMNNDGSLGKIISQKNFSNCK